MGRGSEEGSRSIPWLLQLFGGSSKKRGPPFRGPYSKDHVLGSFVPSAYNKDYVLGSVFWGGFTRRIIYWGLFWSPYSQDHSILGAVFGPHVFKNSHLGSFLRGTFWESPTGRLSMAQRFLMFRTRPAILAVSKGGLEVSSFTAGRYRRQLWY